MSENAASTGLGMFLTPAQGAATTSGKAPSFLSSTDVSDENISTFSSVFAGQQEPAKDISTTQEVPSTVWVPVVVEPKTNLDEVMSDALSGGQTLPLAGNTLPVPVTIPAATNGERGDSAMPISGAAATGATASVSTSLLVDTNSTAGSQSTTAAFDADSIVGQIVQTPSTTPESHIDTTMPVPAVQESVTTATSQTAGDTAVTTSLLVSTANSAQAQQVATVAVTTPVQTDATPEDEGGASLNLISMLDRKAKVGEPSKSEKPLTIGADSNSSADAMLSDDLLLKNLQADTSSNLGDDSAGLQQKIADLTSLMNSKSQNSMEINSLASWRQQGVQSYGANQPVAVTPGAIDIPVGKAGWGEAVLDKVMWMSSQKMDSAEIALDPADLGPMHVRITTHQDQTTVVFTSHHVQVRDALDQASAQLRQNLENQGFGQVNVDVAGQNMNQQMANQGGSEGSGQSSENPADGNLSADAPAAVTVRQSARLGLVDTFV